MAARTEVLKGTLALEHVRVDGSWRRDRFVYLCPSLVWRDLGFHPPCILAERSDLPRKVIALQLVPSLFRCHSHRSPEFAVGPPLRSWQPKGRQPRVRSTDPTECRLAESLGEHDPGHPHQSEDEAHFSEHVPKPHQPRDLEDGVRTQPHEERPDIRLAKHPDHDERDEPWQGQ